MYVSPGSVRQSRLSTSVQARYSTAGPVQHGRSGTARPGTAWHGQVQHGTDWYTPAWHGLVHTGMARTGTHHPGYTKVHHAMPALTHAGAPVTAVAMDEC